MEKVRRKMTKTLSKWEWIEQECMKLGYKESAKIAHELEKVLKKLYGTTITENDNGLRLFLDECFEDGDTPYRRILMLVFDDTFCIACERTQYICQDCLFHKKGYGCGDNTLFGSFITMLKKEVPNETK